MVNSMLTLSTGGCGADISAQVLAQALLGSRPHVDIVEFARTEANERWTKRPLESLKKWQENRNLPEAEAPKTDYIGDYEGFGSTVRFSIRLNSNSNTLSIIYCDKEETTMPLELYSKDTYSAWSEKRDERLSNSIGFWENNVGIFKFYRGQDGAVDSLTWEYCSEEVPMTLEKIRQKE